MRAAINNSNIRSLKNSGNPKRKPLHVVIYKVNQQTIDTNHKLLIDSTTCHRFFQMTRTRNNFISNPDGPETCLSVN